MKNTTTVNMEILVEELTLHERISARTELSKINKGRLVSSVDNKKLLFNMLNHTSVWVDIEVKFAYDVNYIESINEVIENSSNVRYYDRQWLPSSDIVKWDLIVDNPHLSTRKECRYAMAFLPDHNIWSFAPLRKRTVAQVKVEEQVSKLMEEK